MLAGFGALLVWLLVATLVAYLRIKEERHGH